MWSYVLTFCAGVLTCLAALYALAFIGNPDPVYVDDRSMHQ